MLTSMIQFVIVHSALLVPLLTLLLGVNVVLFLHYFGKLRKPEHIIVRAVKFNQPLAVIWALVTTQTKYPEWRRGIQVVESKDCVIEHSRFSTIHYKTSSVSHQSFVRESTHSTWTFEFKPVEGGCVLYVTKEETVSSTILRALWSLYGFESNVVGYLEDLGSHIHQKIVIVKPINGKLSI